MIGGYRLLMWIGVIIIVLPFIGVPSLWKEIILFLIGIILIAQSFFIRHQEKMIVNNNPEEKVFVENNLKFKNEFNN